MFDVVKLEDDEFELSAIFHRKIHLVPLLVIHPHHLPGVLSEGTDGDAGVELEVETAVLDGERDEVVSTEFSHVEQLGLTGSSPELEADSQVAVVNSDIIQLSQARAGWSEDEAGSHSGGRGEAE